MQNCIFYLPFLTVFCLFRFFTVSGLSEFSHSAFCILHYSNQLLSVRRSRADGDS